VDTIVPRPRVKAETLFDDKKNALRRNMRTWARHDETGTGRARHSLDATVKIGIEPT
jgi:hypothetical protein